MKNSIFYALFICITVFSVSSLTAQGTLQVTEGGTNINIGDTFDFGNVIVGLNQANTFVLDNTAGGGSPGRRLNGITVTITGSTDFTPTNSNLGNLAGNGAPINHLITFTPSAVGLRTATVTITFSNGTNDPYTFTIQGTGLALAQK